MENTLLNLIPAAYLPEIHLSQYDVGRTITFTLKDGASDYSVPSGASVKVKATKPSGFGFEVACTFNGGTVTLVTTDTMTPENGRFPAELSIVNGNTTIGTSNFIFNIERSPHPEGTIDGDAESLLPELTLLVERIEAAADSVHNLTVEGVELAPGSTPTVSYNSAANKITFGLVAGENGEVTYEDLSEGVTRGNLVIMADDLEQGYWDATSVKAESAIRIRTKRAYKVSADTVISLSNQPTASLSFKVFALEPDGTNWQNSRYETQWLTNGEYTVGYDGYVVINIRQQSDERIDPSFFTGILAINGLPPSTIPWTLNLYIDKYIKSKFIIGKSHSGGGTYQAMATRNAILKPLCFDFPITIKSDGNHDFAYQIYDGYEIGQSHLVEAGAWINNYVMPANTYFCMIVRNNDNTATDEATTEALTFIGEQPLNEQISDTYEPATIKGSSYVVGADLMKRTVNTMLVDWLTLPQSFCRYNGDWYSTDGTTIRRQDSVGVAQEYATINAGHGNSLQLGSGGHAYISGWDDNKVYEINLNGFGIVRVIDLPTTGYTTCAVDEGRGLIYIFQRDTYPVTEEYYNFITYDYINDSVVSTKKTSVKFSAMQGCDFFDDKIIVLNGLGTSSCPNGYRVFDIYGNILAEYFFDEFSTIEPEGVCIDRNTHELYISLLNTEVYKVY